MNPWTMQPFDALYRRVNAKDKQVQTSQVTPQGALPVVDQGKASIAGYTNDEAKRFVPPPGGIIVFGDHTRIVKFVRHDFALGADGTQLLVARDGLNTKFLAYLLANQEIPNTGYNRHFKFLKEMVLTVPTDLSEQEAIAEALSDADAMIEGLERLIAKKRLIKQGAIQDLLTARRRTNGRVEERDDQGHPIDWQHFELSELASFITGPFGSTFHKSDYVRGGIPLINPSHIVSGEIVPDEGITISAEMARGLNVFALRENDVVIGRRGEMGRCAVVTASSAGYLCGTGAMIVRPKDGSMAELLQAILSSPNVIADIEENSVGTTMINLNQATLASLRVFLPSSSEERIDLATVLLDMDTEIQTLETRLEKARAVKEGMMQNLLTGRIRLV